MGASVRRGLVESVGTRDAERRDAGVFEIRLCEESDEDAEELGRRRGELGVGRPVAEAADAVDGGVGRERSEEADEAAEVEGARARAGPELGGEVDAVEAAEVGLELAEIPGGDAGEL